jgi:DNA-binding transcriptional regulator YiaG
MTGEYHYTESGLDNVVLVNVEVCTDDDGDEVYAIPNIRGLHKVIAHGLITQPCGLAPSELRFLRTEIGMTQGELAQILKKDHQTIGRWERGETPIDQNAEAVLRRIVAERLGIDTGLSMEELARRCVPSAIVHRIVVDGSDPANWRLAA